jgi:thiamine-phosphate pyrophosphorylase
VRCRAAGVRLLVNDRADVALATGAGVHLPAAGLSPADARRMLGPDAIVGRSAHDAGELPAAAGADFLLFGPVFDTASKRAFGAPQGVERLRAFCAASPVPVLAVGGIDAGRVREVLRAGAAGIAVIGAVWRAADVASAVRDLLSALRESA